MIKQIAHIQDLYDFVNFKRKPIAKTFDIITHQETYPDTYKMIPAHRRDFYTIIFLEAQQEGKMNINDKSYEQQENVLFFQSPQHVFSFIRGEKMRGYMLCFRPEFLLPFCKDPLADYDFFRLVHNNLFVLDQKEKNQIVQLFKQIIAVQQEEKVVKHLLLALLEKAKIIEEHRLQIKEAHSSLYDRFKKLINNHFIEERSVGFYAEQLHISANYLNQKIKEETGKTAKEHITSRLLVEAKNMLQYSELDIAEISYILQFSEPSYFGKFFKKHTQLSPKAYRIKR